MRLSALFVLAVLTAPTLSAPLWAQEAGDLPVEETVPEAAEVPAEDAAPEMAPAVPVEPAPAATVTAEQPHGLYEELGSAGDWTAIRFQPMADRTVCAIFSRPTDSTITEGGNAISALRGERAAFITWESGTVEDAGGVFSAMVGAPLASPFDGHSFTTEAGTFTMFGHDDRLYTEAESDAAAIEAIRKGMTLSVTAALPGGRVAQDTYSLKGVMAATKLAAETCVVAQ